MPAASTLFAPRPQGARRRAPSLVDVRLDPAQRAATALPRGQALLVLGEAGHGKTTVALHRLAHLWKSSPETLRAAVVVPTAGLARLLQPMLRQLGVDVEALTYDAWVNAEARRAFRRLPPEAELAPPLVMRLKRHPALLGAIEVLAKRAPGRVDDDADAPVERTSAHVSRGDLQHLFGDRRLLQQVADEAGTLGALAVGEVLERTRVQFTRTTEVEWAHVTDARRLRSVDARSIDAATATAHAHTIDVEDYAVLFELDRRRAERRSGRAAAPRSYDVLVIDEAQELAPIELMLLGRSLKPNGTLIVAGDAAQQTDPTTSFPGWSEAMRALGRDEHRTVHLDVGYRCPQEVARLARSIARIDVPEKRPAREHGAPTRVLRADDERALGGAIGRELALVQRRDPRASIVVLCRSPMTARRFAEHLRAEVPARLVWSGEFLPRGPVQVTTVDEAKGLEFDYVIVPDADPRSYPDDDASRRALYVAVTRTRHQLLLACVGEFSAIVAGHAPT